jgi:glucose-1-phosphate cytidylyltransferase
VKAVLLCGGLGTRLREYTDNRPKPMVEIGGKPILWHIMRSFAHYGIQDFVVCLGYRGDVIRNYFLNYDAMQRDCTLRVGGKGRGAGAEIVWHEREGDREPEFRVTLAETGAETMTGGRLAAVQRYLGGETFLLTYGDGVADVRMDELIRFHQAHGKTATVTAVQPRSRYGEMKLHESGAVQGFEEKPQSASWINAGFFVFNPGIFDYLDGPRCVLERQPLEALAAKGELQAFRHRGYFQAMDTFPEHQQLNQLWNAGDAPWKVWGAAEAENTDSLLHLAGQLAAEEKNQGVLQG